MTRGLPRIYYLHPLLAGPLAEWARWLDHCAGLGFDTILVASPFAPGPDGRLFRPGDLDRLHPALQYEGSASEGLGKIASLCSERRLTPMLDVALHRFRAAAEPGEADAPDPRVAADAADARAPDPAEGARDNAASPHFGPPHFGPPHLGPPDAGQLSQRLESLAATGIAGFCCRWPDRLPASVLQAAFRALRSVAGHCRLLAWTPGMPREAAARLQPLGFDAAFSSLRWWDGRAEWLLEEHAVLRRLGPVLAFPEAPFGQRLAADTATDAEHARAARRVLRLAAALGDGLLVPMGFEYGARTPLDPAGGSPADMAELQAHPVLDLTSEIAAANRFMATQDDRYVGMAMRSLTGPDSAVTGILRADRPDPRAAGRARLVLVNPELSRPASMSASGILTRIEAGIRRFASADPEAGRRADATDGLTLCPGTLLALAPGEVQVLEGTAGIPVRQPTPPEVESVDAATAAPRLAIENIIPAVDGGRFPVKRIQGDEVRVEADVLCDGHDVLAAVLLWRPADAEAWQEIRMRPLGNDRWAAELPLERMGRHLFTIEAWRDAFATFRAELKAKHDAGQGVALELEEGRRLVAAAVSRAPEETELKRLADRLAGTGTDGDGTDERVHALLAPETAAAMARADDRPFAIRHDPPRGIEAERPGAGFANWYEIFPRSQSGSTDRHGTFDDVIARLPAIRGMGFDVLYFPPIHPIGRTNRKGKNNSLTPGPDDPGSPYAIGSEDGGHDAIHPELGTLEDFRRLSAAAADHELELALDFAIQCSPDHPWLKDHPEWFSWRPDGSIRFAENPPKKYEDIVNVEFYADGALPGLWLALRDIVLFWVREGVKLFRVDNPHTKPFPFWEWLIAEVRSRHPEVVFLSEAFTRPKVMYRLAKVGFSQSYTYFTWRTTKPEFIDYLTELADGPPREFFRPHFFVNTPDINPPYLHDAPRPAFLIRAALAATLSGLWGVYNGFELCEGRAIGTKGEYLDSEKYEIRAWDWDRPGNIIPEITALNRIRRGNPALHSHLGVAFHACSSERVLFFSKATPGRDNVVLVAISFDPHIPRDADVELPLWAWGLPDDAALAAEDLLHGHRFVWHGKHQRIRLDPADLPYGIWRVHPVREA